MRTEAKTPRVMVVFSVIIALVGFVIEVAEGHDANAYEVIGVVGGLAYVAAVVYFRVRT